MAEGPQEGAVDVLYVGLIVFLFATTWGLARLATRL
jgi:hypothetical protein